jgi:hypothetical protein
LLARCSELALVLPLVVVAALPSVLRQAPWAALLLAQALLQMPI